MEFSEISQKLSKRRSRTKGLTFERWVAQKLRHIFPEVRRHLEFQKGEANGVDLSNTGQYKIQCKRFAKYAPMTCIEEVQYHAWLGEVPVLITAGNDKPALAVIPLDEFIRLVEKDMND